MYASRGFTAVRSSVQVNALAYVFPLESRSAKGFSLRRLRSGYRGSAVRVRRASDNAEQDIGFLSNVFNIAALNTFLGGSQGFVRTFYNQGQIASNLSLEQTNPSAQPEIVVTSIGGKPGLRFNGSQFMSLNLNLSQPSIITALFQSQIVAHDGIAVVDGLATNERRLFLHGTSSSSRSIAINSGADFVSGFASMDMNTPYLVSGVFSSTANASRIFYQ